MKLNIEGSLEFKTFEILDNNRFICTIDKLKDAKHIARCVNERKDILNSLKSLLLVLDGWPSVTHQCINKAKNLLKEIEGNKYVGM